MGVKCRVLLISDTHGRLTYFPTALKKAGKIDMILHMGDSMGDLDKIAAVAGVPVESVRGNCDYYSQLPAEKELNICEVSVFMTHGHRYYVSSGLGDLIDEAERRFVSVVLFGHTHVPYMQKIDDIIYVNPGSLSQPRQSDRKPSFAIMEIDEDGRPYFSMHKV